MKCIVCAGYWAQDLTLHLSVNLPNSTEKQTQLGSQPHGESEAQKRNLCTATSTSKIYLPYLQQRSKSWLKIQCNPCLHQDRKSTSRSIHNDPVSNTTPNLYKLLLHKPPFTFLQLSDLYGTSKAGTHPQLDNCKTQYIKSYQKPEFMNSCCSGSKSVSGVHIGLHTVLVQIPAPQLTVWP